MTCNSSGGTGCCNHINSGCGCSPCRCSVSTLASPAPFYTQHGQSQESHCCPEVIKCFAMAISPTNDFIMPSCGSSAIVTFEGITSIQIGSYLWNVTFGYLLVTDINYLTYEVTLYNDCYATNAAPGTFIPKTSLFSLAIPARSVWVPWSPTLFNTNAAEYANYVIKSASYYTFPGIVYYKFSVSFDIVDAAGPSNYMFVSLPIEAVPATDAYMSCGSGRMLMEDPLKPRAVIGSIYANAPQYVMVSVYDSRSIAIMNGYTLTMSGFYEV